MSRRDSRDLAQALSSKARSDEAVLERLLSDPDVPDDVLGFHAQQAAEKLLKAVLAHHSITFERTHNLAYLLGLLEDSGIAGPPDHEALGSLTPWATQFRYEDPVDAGLSRGDVGSALGSVRIWADEQLTR